MTTLRGLLNPQGATPEARRRYVRELGDARLADAIFTWARELRVDVRSGAWDDVSTRCGAPWEEVHASPFGLRAVVMAADAGVRLLRRESRVVMRSDGLEDADHSSSDSDDGYWERGVLSNAKYVGFTQDDPHAVYNPNHMAKWTPHEMMHRAVGYFWRANATAWELYLGARLNELVPVVLWYGPDEVLRGHCRGFDRAAWTERPYVDRTDLLWLDVSEAELQDLSRESVRWLRQGLAHFEREWIAIQEELETCNAVRVVDDLLDASSDAMAYVAAHKARLRTRAVSRVLDTVPIEGVHFDRDIHRYVDRVAESFDTLLFADVEWRPARAEALSQARTLWDWALRTAHVGWRPLRPAVRHLTAIHHELGHCEREGRVHNPNLRDALIESLGDVAARILSDGSSATPEAIEQVREGIQSVAPATLRWVSEAFDSGLLERFVASPLFQSRANLGSRFADFLACEPNGEPLAELARLEVLVAHATLLDPLREFIADPKSFDSLNPNNQYCIRKSTNFTAHRFNYPVDLMHRATHPFDVLPAPQVEPMWLLIGFFDGGVSIVRVPPGIYEWWRTFGDRPQLMDDAIAGLAEAQEDLSPEDIADAWPQGPLGWLVELDTSGVIGVIEKPQPLKEDSPTS